MSYGSDPGSSGCTAVEFLPSASLAVIDRLLYRWLRPLQSLPLVPFHRQGWSSASWRLHAFLTSQLSRLTPWGCWVFKAESWRIHQDKLPYWLVLFFCFVFVFSSAFKFASVIVSSQHLSTPEIQALMHQLQTPLCAHQAQSTAYLGVLFKNRGHKHFVQRFI